MDIVAGTEDEMPRIMEIESEAFYPPWTTGGILSEIHSERTFFPLAIENNVILGFAILKRTTQEEGELLQIAVAKDHRRRGVGDALLRAALEWADSCGVEIVHLQVRESNEAAISLYYKYGFLHVGRRKDYYISPTEDALTMERRI